MGGYLHVTTLCTSPLHLNFYSLCGSTPPLSRVLLLGQLHCHWGDLGQTLDDLL